MPSSGLLLGLFFILLTVVLSAVHCTAVLVVASGTQTSVCPSAGRRGEERKQSCPRPVPRRARSTTALCAQGLPTTECQSANTWGGQPTPLSSSPLGIPKLSSVTPCFRPGRSLGCPENGMLFRSPRSTCPWLTAPRCSVASPRMGRCFSAAPFKTLSLVLRLLRMRRV